MAVPILLRHSVPATLFVSTGIVGTDQLFPHDAEKPGRAPPTLSWDQIARIHDLGFAVGGHTANHIDCGSTDEDIVRRELVESRDVLRDRLGLDEVLFAFPYGRPENITPRVLGMVAELGYSACFSANGGFQDRDVDRFNIKRIGINANFSPAAFRAALEGFYA